jgi:hypothetical protein
VVVFDAGSGATRSYWAKTQRRVATFAPTIVHDLAGLGRYPIRSAADRASTDHTTVAMACRHVSALRQTPHTPIAPRSSAKGAMSLPSSRGHTVPITEPQIIADEVQRIAFKVAGRIGPRD